VARVDNDVYIIPFKYKHLEKLKELHALRNNALNTQLTMQDLPKIGYIAFLGKSPVAAGFLRRVEPNYAQFDTFLSNPYFGSQIRHLAMSLVTEELLRDSKELGLRMVLAITSDDSILSRAKDNGFEIINQTLLAKFIKP
jgi:hypothetical protein